MSETISSFLSKDHKLCDEVFAFMQEAVDQDHWQEADKKFLELHNCLEHHFKIEESILFPLFEEKIGISKSDISIMKIEHSQIMNMMKEIKEDINKQDIDHFFEISESLSMVIQQHNIKEEQMLFPMTDEHLFSEVPLIIENIKNLEKEHV